MFEGLIASFAANKLKYILGGIAAIALIAGIGFYFNSREKHQRYIDNEFTEKGRVEERAQGQSEVINHVQEATHAVTHATDADRSVVCQKYDRNCPHR